MAINIKDMQYIINIGVRFSNYTRGFNKNEVLFNSIQAKKHFETKK